jgi:PAS domain S-box-containing protein
MSGTIDRRLNSEEEYRNIFEAASEALVIFDMDIGLVLEANPAACEMYGYTHQEFLGINPAVFMQPKSYVLFREHIRTAEADKVIESLLIHIHKDGSPFHVEVRKSTINYRGRTCLLSAIRDVSRRIQVEKDLSEQIEARRREQATLLAISHTLASTLELQPGLILDQLREIIKFTQGGLFALEDSTLVTLAMRGTLQLERSAPISIHSNTPEKLAALFNRHRPIRVADVHSDDLQAQFLRSLLDDGAGVLLEGMQSWMWVPLAVKDRIIGGIGIAETSRNYFTVHHAELALSIANQAAITMINAELYNSAKDLAVLGERQRLARNLHDAVNQSLFSAGLIAEVLPRLWDRDQQEARRSLEDLRRLTRGAQAEMRALLAELRPSTLTDSSLSELLHLLGNAFEGRTSLPVMVTVTGEFTLPAEVQVAFYRVCQEALNNVAKHAKASHVEIDLKQDGSVIELRIRDDGLGFDTEQMISGHYGLGMMRERTEAAGARLSVMSQTGHGTDLTIRWTQRPPKESL